MNSDERYMRRALELAALGAGKVAPNPMVGAVVVHNDRIIGEGYHQKYGEAHAEVNAIQSVANHDLLSESTIYVSLEPCAHHGKTPPCADLIVEKQIKRVVIGCGDSFEAVNGKGIQRLKNAGIEVSAFVLENEARSINKRFFTSQEKQRPFVVLKWAETRNGLVDSSEGENGSITWISQPEVQPFVHLLRSENAAILVGKNTILKDNPSLTVRAVKGENPMRIVLDRQCSLPQKSKVLADGNPTIVLNTMKSEESGLISYVKIDEMSPKTILNTLHQKNIQSVFIEGGAATLQSFIDANLWDEAIQIIGQHTFNSGTQAPTINGTLIDETDMFGDRIKRYRP